MMLYDAKMLLVCNYVIYDLYMIQNLFKKDYPLRKNTLAKLK